MMSLPAGVTTFDLVYGNTTDFEGTPLRTELTIFPSHEIVWAATGERLTPIKVSSVAAAGEFNTVQLPHTDQAGFVDVKGNALTNWWYTVQSTDFTAANAATAAPRLRKLQATSDITSVDLDLVSASATVGPVGSVPLPPVLSVNGQVGAVTVTADLSSVVPLAEKGAAEGVAELDADSLVPLAQIPVADIAADPILTNTFAPVSLATTVAGKVDIEDADPSWRVRPGGRVLFHGSSIMHGDDQVVNGADQPRNAPPTHALLHSDGRWRRQANTSVDGSTSTAQLASLPAALAAHQPSVVVLDPIPNDAASSFATATTIANVNAMVNLCAAAGAKVVICNGTPAPNLTYISRLNAALEMFCSRRGIPIVDWHGLMVDIATGGLKTADKGAPNNDNTHPNYGARQKLGWAIDDVLRTLIPPYSPLFDHAADPADLLGGKGFFLSTTDVAAPAGLPDDWTHFSGTAAEVTFATVTVAGVRGKMLQVTSAAGTGSNMAVKVDATTGFSVGDVLELTGIYRTANAPQLQSVTAMAQFRDNADGIISGSAQPEAFNYTNGMQGAVEFGTFVKVLPPVPAGTTKIHVRLKFSSTPGNYVGQFGNVGLRNLTAAGITAPY